IAVVGDMRDAEALAALIRANGCESVAIGAEPLAAHGINAVSGITVRRDGREDRIECDAVAVCSPVSPAFELARQGGARVMFDGQRFVVEADADGRTGHPDIFVAGEITGPKDLDSSIDSGIRAARSALSANGPSPQPSPLSGEREAPAR